MRIIHLSTPASLGVALALVLAALLAAGILTLVLPFTPNAVFIVAIALSVLIGGIKAGIASLTGSIMAINFFFMAPVCSLTLGLDDLWRLGSLSIAALVAGLQRRSLLNSDRGSDNSDS